MPCNSKKRKIIGIILAILVAVISNMPQVKQILLLPDEIKVSVGEEIKFDLNFSDNFIDKVNYLTKMDGNNLLQIGGQHLAQGSFNSVNGWPQAVNPGKLDLMVKICGIPVKKVSVDIVPNVTVVPGGHSIGVLMRSKGVMVVGFSPVINEKNEEYYPAKEAGINLGDIILEVNGKAVQTDGEAAQLIDSLGKDNKIIKLLIKRKEKEFTILLKPIFCHETQRNRVGLYIRDSAAGVGTLTFYEPESKIYGALGHIISDEDTTKQISLGEGRIINSSIQGINKGEKGKPGEKLGAFTDRTSIRGNIKKNIPYGIYGNLESSLKNELYKSPIPVALASQVKEGKAEILTVIKNEKIERFQINIDKVFNQKTPDCKSMIISITDPKLLAETGGIVQGMSGSPIIQDGKLVGAVTHVFINNPQKGYGVFAEWMLINGGVLEKSIKSVNLGANNSSFFVIKKRE